ncbi:MAG: 4-hydroxy-tetrahydrodipicolinate synthase [Termitinemataceae bacterium]|nr:MAG: 4-hydroxy-tetrahydrodipicolinate synthase [Termitinemataceae bacterium]
MVKTIKELRGAFTALISPMHSNGDVDYDGFKRLLEFQMENGIDGLVPLGTTGETPTLEESEEEKMIEIAVKEVGGKIPLIIGTGSNSTVSMLQYTRRAKDLGADAALVVTPYYNKPNDEGLIRHFEAAASVGIPIIIYNIAGRTGRNISAALTERLSRINGIVGVKEASGDLNQMGDVICGTAAKRRAEGKAFTVLCGDDGLTLPLIALGGDGVISVVSNLLPAKVVALTKACLTGDFERARALHYELLPFIKAAFVETNPVPIKAAMSIAGLPSGPTRLPLGKLSKDSETILRNAMPQ